MLTLSPLMTRHLFAKVFAIGRESHLRFPAIYRGFMMYSPAIIPTIGAIETTILLAIGKSLVETKRQWFELGRGFVSNYFRPVGAESGMLI